MQKIKLFAGLLMLIALAGCAGSPVTRIAVLSEQTGPQGDQYVIARTRARPSAGESYAAEVKDVKCTARHSNRSVNFLSPAKIRVPLNGQASGSLAISCKKEGYQTGVETAQIFNYSKHLRTSTGAQSGVLGILAVGITGGFGDKEGDIYKYPQQMTVRLPLKRQ